MKKMMTTSLYQKCHKASPRPCWTAVKVRVTANSREVVADHLPQKRIPTSLRNADPVRARRKINRHEWKKVPFFPDQQPTKQPPLVPNAAPIFSLPAPKTTNVLAHNCLSPLLFAPLLLVLRLQNFPALEIMDTARRRWNAAMAHATFPRIEKTFLGIKAAVGRL